MNSNKKDDLNLFSDKRHRENRLRRSVVAIDDTDFLMEMRSARRRSIVLMNNDDMHVSSGENTGWNQVWNTISTENIRNILPLNRSLTRANEAECRAIDGEEADVLRNPIPKLQPGEEQRDSQTVTTENETECSLASFPSESSRNTSMQSISSSLRRSLDPTTETRSGELGRQRPPWFSHLGALSRWERRQEKAYHDTLDERHEVTAAKHSRANPNHHQQYIPNSSLLQWQRRGSSRDGLDFSRNIDLAKRHDSIYALADSVTQFPAMNEFMKECNEVDDFDINTGYRQDLRPAVDLKTKKCVLDLIA